MIKKVIILIIIISFIFGIFIFYKNYKIVKAQSSSIGIEIYALDPSQNWQAIPLSNAIDDIYKTHPFSTVASGTPFRMILKDGGRGNFDFEIWSKNTRIFATSSTNCGALGGRTKTEGNTGQESCIIEGWFNNLSGNYSFVTFIYRKGGVTASTSIFIVNPNYGGRNPDIPNRQDQFFLEPIYTTTEPTSTITYTIYNNKAYCISSLASTSKSTTTPGDSGFQHFDLDTNEFISNSVVKTSVVKTLILKGVNPRSYSLSLKSNNNKVSSSSTIQVSLGGGVSPPLPLPGTCPVGSQAYNPSTNICYRCFFGYCQYWNPSEQRWVTTSNSACEGAGLRCRAGGVRE